MTEQVVAQEHPDFVSREWPPFPRHRYDRGEAIGVIPDFLVRYEVGHRRLTELIITGSMHDRKRQMFEMADAFVVLPGGLGTLAETFEIVTWKQIRLHEAQVVILDVEGYWAPLRALIEATVAAGFAHGSAADLVSVVATPEEVLQVLAAAPAAKEGGRHKPPLSVITRSTGMPT